MVLRPFRRALVLAVIGTLALAGAASADMVRADGDSVQPGPQTVIDLGDVAPSAIVTATVDFELVCSSFNHVDPGQSVTLTFAAQSAPPGGSVLSATTATVGPVPDDWAADTTDCPSPAPIVGTTVPSTVTLQAPSSLNAGYVYTVGWSRSLTPAGSGDGAAISGTMTGISFTLDVVANAAPVLVLPGDQTVEGDVTDGWTADYVVSATDAEDDPDPTPDCSPATGEVLSLGTTTVACSVTDSGGRTTTGTFDVTVVDTTAPSITAGEDQSVTTDDPAGTVVVYDEPVVADVVDPDATASCDPASGSVFPVGTTTVTCTATDASGNSAQASFAVHVTLAESQHATVMWWEPVGAGTEIFVANHGRTIPLKATLTIDGVERAAGTATLDVTSCDQQASLAMPMSFSGGRWNVGLDTSLLSGGCHIVSASIDGLQAGWFQLDLRGAGALKASGKGGAKGNAKH